MEDEQKRDKAIADISKVLETLKKKTPKKEDKKEGDEEKNKL